MAGQQGQAMRRKFSVAEMRSKLLETGLDKHEVDKALEGAALVPDAPSSPSVVGGMPGLRALRKSNLQVKEMDQDSKLVDPFELLDMIEDSKGRGQSSSVVRQQSGGFATWVERIEALLEEKDEADYVAKKQLAAQVRAYLAGTKRSSSFDSDNDSNSSESTASEDVHAHEDGEHAYRIEERDVLKESKPLPTLPEPANGWTGTLLFERFLSGNWKLPRKYVRTVLDNFIKAFDARYGSRMSLLREFEVPKDGKLVVVGDTHGQLEDVLTIFLQHGQPSPKIRYLFNGDIADRGPNGVEIFVLLFAFYLEDPSCIMINRGNHEDDEMNKLSAEEGGGFQKEVLEKYGHCPLMKFNNIFKMLPLATVVNQELFVVHGGLARNAKINLSLDYIASIDATEVCCPAANASTLKEQVFSDLLWSDPSEKLGFQPSPRGAGQLWGPDMTRAFLKRTGLKWIIRSHQLPRDRRGWEEHHLGLVFTVFSASNYQGHCENKGAVAVLELPPAFDTTKTELLPRFYEFYAPGKDELARIGKLPEGQARSKELAEAGATKASHDHIVVGERRESFVLNRMAGRVVERRPELWENFMETDALHTGMIEFDLFCDLLASLCGDHFPWSIASERWKLAIRQKNGTLAVDYKSFLARFEVGLSQEQWVGWKALLMRDVYEACMRSDTTIKECMRHFDKDGNGSVSLSEFIQVLMQEMKGGCTRAQLLALARGLFPENEAELDEGQSDPEIDVHAFFERFTIVYHQTMGMLSVDPLAEWRPTLTQIGRQLVAFDKTKDTRHNSRDQKGLPTATAVVISKTKSEQDLQNPANAEAKSKGMATSSSAKTLPVAGRPGSPVPPIPSFRRRPTNAGEGEMGRVMDRLFSLFDDNGDGHLQIDEFVDHMMEVPGIETVKHKGEPLGSEHLRELGEALDAMSGEKTGRVNFIQFLEAFVIDVVAAKKRQILTEAPKGDQKVGNSKDRTFHKEEAEAASVEHILSVLYRHRHTLWCGCTEKDPHLAGRIAEKDFAHVIDTTDLALAQAERHFTKTQIQALTNHLAEEDGKVPYVEFLQALVVRDSLADTRQRSVSVTSAASSTALAASSSASTATAVDKAADAEAT